MSMEDRLRTHYAERTEHEPLPGPDTDESLARLLSGEISTPQSGETGNVRRFPIRPLALAAAVLAICAVAGLLVIQTTDDNSLSTEGGEDRPDRPDPTTPTTQPEPPTSSVPTSTPDTTAAPPQPSASTTVIVGPYGPLGWWDGGAWRNDRPPVAGGEEYSILRLDDPITTAPGGWGDGCGITDEPGSVVDVELANDIDWRIPNPIAVTGVPNPRPRPVRIGDVSAADYKAAAVGVVAGLGIDDPDPDIAQAVRVDLDGDGTDEVLVTAERVPSDGGIYPQAGDYSVVFMRQTVGGSVQTTILAQSMASHSGVGSVYFMDFFRLAAVADLNGDGRMEVAIGSNYYEGAYIRIHELLTDGTAPQVLTGGCGA